MATPTTVLEFAQNAHDAYAAAKAAAQIALTAAQEGVTAARAALEAATAAMKAKEQEISAKRVEVASADTPAEGEALLAELIALIAGQRVLQGDLIDARDSAADATSGAALGAARLSRIRGRLAQAEGDLASAMIEDDQRTSMKSAATAPPLDTIAADATAALTEEPYTIVQTFVTAAIPAALLAAARRGYEVEVARRGRLELSRQMADDLLMDEVEANHGVAGLVLRREIELARAERELRDWTDGAKSRYDRAASTLASIAAGTGILSAAEIAGVQALDAAPGQAAANLREDLLDAREAAYDAELDLQDVTRAALAPDPTADVAAITEVVSAQTALGTANTTLEAAQAAYDANAADYMAWTAEVPDTGWRKVLGFVEADELLQELSEIDNAHVTALLEAVTDAEETLAAALDAAASDSLTVAFLEDHVTLGAGRLVRSDATYPERLLSAIRAAD